MNSKGQTKTWRMEQDWYETGKKNECEINQRSLIEKIINNKCEKTQDRICKLNNLIESKINPYKYEDGFEWTENFDGKIIIDNMIYYFNLKFVCEAGGAQIRTLKEVYDFIKAQINFLMLNNTTNIYFYNILDGDTSFKNRDKFDFLIKKNKESNIDISKYIFIGDMKEFYDFWKNKN